MVLAATATLFLLLIPFNGRVKGIQHIGGHHFVGHIANLDTIHFGNGAICDGAINLLLVILRVCHFKIVFRAFTNDMFCFFYRKRDIVDKNLSSSVGFKV